MRPISRESNFVDSLKKYLLDALTPKGIDISFDRTLKLPDLQEVTMNEWVVVNFGNIDYQRNAHIVDVLVSVCTRQDPDGYQNVRISDYVRSLFVDETMTDGMARINLFDSQHGWAYIGTALPVKIVASPATDLEDQTKVKPLTVRFWYAV